MVINYVFFLSSTPDGADSGVVLFGAEPQTLSQNDGWMVERSAGLKQVSEVACKKQRRQAKEEDGQPWYSEIGGLWILPFCMPRRFRGG